MGSSPKTRLRRRVHVECAACDTFEAWLAHIRVNMHTHTYIHAFVAHIRIYMHTWHTYIRTCTRGTHTYIHAYTYVYTCIRRVHVECAA